MTDRQTDRISTCRLDPWKGSSKKGPLKWHDKKDQFSAVTKGGQLNELKKGPLEWGKKRTS